ncbi:MAG: 50S ribosomal protein L15 [Candidatus Roseilinea sp.]|uniref:50S ribosomal protein L15 n=1 Tax=Candidatus Roseilinea sp. TaxID=2838777 RepID=UPI00404903AF
MKLHDLRPAPGSRKPKRRKGIGIAAGQGKTAGRGQKGQKSRSGGVKRGYFEGGQLPLVRKLPFARGVGFVNPYRIEYAPVNVGDLAATFQAGAEVTPQTMVEAGLVDKGKKYIAILGDGVINVPLKVTAHKFSATAKARIEQAGGTTEQIKVTRGGYRTR